ncbi:MAG: family 78 glycoside hydrolase catalytic domain [Opitutaceae bacterium]|nr:family 78 glycoside hydrolase catalytic domain [Opitutaceae bacterium]MBP8961780.1 family 78 glycoside hydrolase catalytic domain [Opitutaceae bacterium]
MLFWLRTRLAQPSPGTSAILRLAITSVVLGFAAITDAHALSVGQMTTNGRINPLGIGGDALSLAWSIESDTRGTVQGAYRVRVGTTESAWSAPAWFEIGLPAAEWAEAKWIAHPQPAPASNGQSVTASALPLFRRVVTLAKPVKRARLYATAHGVYQFSLNGQKVGDQFLAPGWTDYAKRLQVQTYDVTSLLHTGANALGAALADGWYHGKVGLNWPGIYGDTLAVIAKLRVTYADGSTEDFVTDESWRSSEGPFVQADLQDGETYDARREQTGWDRADFDASTWLPVTVVPGDSRVLVPQPDEPVRATEVVTARSRSEPAPGEYVYDLGQNLIGFARIKLTGKAGQTIRLRFAEEINRQGERRGRLYTESLRTAKATDTYTFARDETVVYQPTFTQHGFRYVEVTGTTLPPEAGDVAAVVLGSDLRNTGDLRLSHPMIDQLVRNIRWGQRGNFLSIPTDTPARDERLGWTGDLAVFATTASRYQDTRAFLSKWMDDLRDAQRADGNIPAIVPQPRDYFGLTGVGWSDAFIIVPYTVWRATGDTRILRQNWEAMRRFYAFVHASATQDGNLLEEGRSSFFSGDWLSLENVDRLAEHRVIATAYFAEDTRMMAEMAAALGDTALAAEWAALVPKIREAFVAAYRYPDGSLEIGTQTVYAMALGMDLIADPAARALTAGKFVEKLAADNFHLKTGFLGTPWLLPALSKIGRDDLAMRLLLNEDYPSWGFEIRMGATTMWERWNTIRADGQFGPVEMNSFNHYAYGAVGDWMFGHLGGVQIVEPGYKKFRIAPLVEADALDHATCHLQTPHGLIRSEWTRTQDGLRLAVTVPANTCAEIVVPARNAEAVREGEKPVASVPGVVQAVAQDGQVHLTVGSGRYEFSVLKN